MNLEGKSGMENIPDKSKEKLKDYFDENGIQRNLRELPDGTVVLLSNKEFSDEMENRREEVSDIWLKEKKTPKYAKGKRDLGSFIESKSYKEPKFKSLLE